MSFVTLDCQVVEAGDLGLVVMRHVTLCSSLQSSKMNTIKRRAAPPSEGGAHLGHVFRGQGSLGNRPSRLLYTSWSVVFGPLFVSPLFLYRLDLTEEGA